MNRHFTDQTHTPLAYDQKKQGRGSQLVTAIGQAMNRMFHTDKDRIIIIGYNPITRFLSGELNGIGDSPLIVNLGSESTDDGDTMPSIDTVDASLSDHAVLDQVGADRARCLLAALKDDDRNLSLCRDAVRSFDIGAAIGRLRLVPGLTTWARVSEDGLFRLSWRDLVQTLVPSMSLTASLARVAVAEDREQIAEIEIRLPTFVGRTVNDLPLENCDVVALTRKPSYLPADQETPLEMGDVITLIGAGESLKRIRQSFASL